MEEKFNDDYSEDDVDDDDDDDDEDYERKEQTIIRKEYIYI
jgi:hypothetical protein